MCVGAMLPVAGPRLRGASAGYAQNSIAWPAGGTGGGGDKFYQDMLIPIDMPSRIQTEVKELRTRHYSYRSATMGSIFVARRAGM